MLRTLVFSLLALSLTSGLAATSASAKTCLVNKLQYENKAEYRVDGFRLRYRDGKTKPLSGDSVINSQSRTVDLSNHTDVINTGDEVWLVFQIGLTSSSGRWKSCQKDDTKLVYDPAKGNTWEYYSQGRATHDNRCRFAANTCVSP